MASATRLTYLGVAGWHIETDGFTLVIDPYFTRLPMRRVVFGLAYPNTQVIRQHIPPADAILVTHPHYDHLMDVPVAAHITHAPVFASPQGCQLLELLGVPAGQINRIRLAATLDIGPMRLTVYASQHRAILGRIPYRGPLQRGLRLPLRASDYRMDDQYSFLIECGSLRILVASGIDNEPAVAADVLLLGADATREQIAQILHNVSPRIVFPNHWDDMFRPLAEPIRPMIVPPPGIIPTLRRIDLHGFEHTIHSLDSQITVVLPERFQPYPLA
jgi:L-ascorbate metabolism protein UlaG (beta-lactamase superfamily)